MGLIKKVQAFIQGYKVYLISIGSIIGAVVAFSEGAISAVELFEAISVALGAMAFRSAIGKKEPA